MKHVLRPFLLIAVAFAAAIGLVACGGDDEGSGGGGKPVSSDTDAAQVLDRAFSGLKKVNSGVLTMKLDGTGAEGSAAMELGGPFENQGKNKLPKIAMKLSGSSMGQALEGGLTLTGSKAFVSFRGTDYVVDDKTYQQIAAYVQKAGEDAETTSSVGAIQKLGVDPQKWLSNPQNAGDSEVGGEETVKVTGEANLDAIFKDFNTMAKESSKAVGGGANVPQGITPEQTKAVKSAIKGSKVEVDASKADGGLRRVSVDLQLDIDGKSGKAAVEITLTEVNKPQDFPEPANPKPIQELMSSLGFGGLFGGAGAGAGTTPGGTSGATPDQEKLAKCIEQAGSDQQKAAECIQQASG